MQSVLPDKIIVVNDHSTDTTEEIIDQYSCSHSIIKKINSVSSVTHMPGSKVVNAFNKGFELLDQDFDIIVKLDADIILPPNYFEKLTEIFKDSRVGIAGGIAYEQDKEGEWIRTHPMNRNHVRGAFKAYRKSCFQAIGGLKSSIGWDTVDELLAKYHSYIIQTDETLQVKHLRPVGKSYNSKARLLQGEAMYKMRYGLCITCIASLKMAWKQRSFTPFRNNILGYIKAKKENKTFLVSKKEGEFIRNLRWKGITQKFFSTD